MGMHKRAALQMQALHSLATHHNPTKLRQPHRHNLATTTSSPQPHYHNPLSQPHHHNLNIGRKKKVCRKIIFFSPQVVNFLVWLGPAGGIVGRRGALASNFSRMQAKHAFSTRATPHRLKWGVALVILGNFPHLLTGFRPKIRRMRIHE